VVAPADADAASTSSRQQREGDHRMIDVIQQIEAVQREVGSARIAAGEGRTVRLRRTFSAGVDEVWDAVTNPERIGRWFLPITGELRVGGRFQLQGNAGGEVVACDAPRRFRVTWVPMDTGRPADVSELEVRLTPDGDARTTLELEHTAVVPDDMWEAYGPGAVGVGWDGGLLGLALHVEGGGSVGDPVVWQASEEARDFYTRSSQAWGAANVAAGADPEAAAKAAANATAFYTVTPETGG
jgi:uncharacterized protein YndB with AHSA1/START domain